MDIPQMEKMSEEDIIAYMKKCARQYVPEWRYEGNLQRHLLFLCFGQELSVTSYANARLSFASAGGSADDKRLKKAFCDPARVRFCYGSGQEYMDITDYTYEQGELCFRLPGGEQGIAPMEEF